ncbi:MAG TPA: nitroreductase [Planctomycetes bacterium]|nr:nitroreductase [Planctomycetota bacterium]
MTDRRTFLKLLPAFTALAGASSGLAGESAAGLQPITLVKPETDGGASVLAALKARKTTRAVSAKELPPQVLSNLLWAAFGVNREEGPRGRIGRTAASASNSQEIDVYVFLSAGAYLYEAIGHRLVPVLAGDHRAKISDQGRRGAMAEAPVNLVYVADIARFAKAPFQEPGLRDPEIQKSYYNVATGLIAGNVYLFAAAHGLAAWFHNCAKERLAGELKLRPDQRVLYAQTVGYPA